MKQQNSFVYRNGLSLTLLACMLLFWAAQLFTGWQSNNESLEQQGLSPLHLYQYVRSGHFIQATFENWESEFLQMAMYVVFTVALRQKGSAESRKLRGEEGAQEEEESYKIEIKEGTPWPVRRGGIALLIYKNSLSIAFALLFLFSFGMHFLGSLMNTNDERLRQHLPPLKAAQYLTDATFWFESFQNWQSEFLAVASIVLLSIWLRQHRSPESKAVSAPHEETGG